MTSDGGVMDSALQTHQQPDNIPHAKGKIFGGVRDAFVQRRMAGGNAEGIIKDIEKGIEVSMQRAGKQ